MSDFNPTGNNTKETLVGSISVGGEMVFDGNFGLISYALGNIGLSAVEVSIVRDGRTYTMEIETQRTFAERAATNYGPEEEQSDEPGGHPYVVDTEEILPSQLMAVKTTPTERLAYHLVEQVE